MDVIVAHLLELIGEAGLLQREQVLHRDLGGFGENLAPTLLT